MQFVLCGRIVVVGITRWNSFPWEEIAKAAKVDESVARNQEPYVRELLRVRAVPATQRDLVPVSRDQARFEAEADEAAFMLEELRVAPAVGR